MAKYFEAEGTDPLTQQQGPFVFSALTAKFDSGHGHGYRNEVKIKTTLRSSLAETGEHFRATITPTLPAGATTIVSQYHVESLDTLVKVYVQDRGEKGLFDGVDSNGIFDILVRTKGTDGHELTTRLGTVRTGESFSLGIDLVHGVVSVEAVTAAHGKQRLAPFRLFEPHENVYFKFGDYLQAWDPDTGKQTTDHRMWAKYFQSRHIDSERIAFSQVRFWRD